MDGEMMGVCGDCGVMDGEIRGVGHDCHEDEYLL